MIVLLGPGVLNSYPKTLIYCLFSSSEGEDSFLRRTFEALLSRIFSGYAKLQMEKNGLQYDVYMVRFIYRLIF